MKKIVKLTERDLTKIVKKTLREMEGEGEGPLTPEKVAKLEANEGWFSDIIDKAKQAQAKGLTAKGVKPMARALKPMAKMMTPEQRAKAKEAMLKKIAEMKPCVTGDSGIYRVIDDKTYIYNREKRIGCRIDK